MNSSRKPQNLEKNNAQVGMKAQGTRYKAQAKCKAQDEKMVNIELNFSPCPLILVTFLSLESCALLVPCTLCLVPSKFICQT